MPFQYFQPAPHLSQYIHSYWKLEGMGDVPDVLYPDGCIDIIANVGDSFSVAQKNVLLERGGVYLGGALTEALYEKIPTGVQIIGVRLLPGCFGLFYPALNLSNTQNDCIPLCPSSLPPLHCTDDVPVALLDDFFMQRVRSDCHPVSEAVHFIASQKGNTTLKEIASCCHKSPRQIERIFNTHIGLTPKQFCDITRFCYSQQLLNDRKGETLLGIALEAGYSDHAHLSKAYKKITRRNPSGA